MQEKQALCNLRKSAAGAHALRSTDLDLQPVLSQYGDIPPEILFFLWCQTLPSTVTTKFHFSTKAARSPACLLGLFVLVSSYCVVSCFFTCVHRLLLSSRSLSFMHTNAFDCCRFWSYFGYMSAMRRIYFFSVVRFRQVFLRFHCGFYVCFQFVVPSTHCRSENSLTTASPGAFFPSHMPAQLCWSQEKTFVCFFVKLCILRKERECYS